MDIRDAGDPVELAARYEAGGRDELVFLDITASHEKRDTIVRRWRGARPTTCSSRSRSAAASARWRTRRPCSTRAPTRCRSTRRRCARPELIGELAEVFGAQCVVLAIDARREPATATRCSPHGGRMATGRDAVEWAREGVERGAGEILLTSMDRDGTEDGYELDAHARGGGRRRRPGDRLGRRGNARPPGRRRRGGRRRRRAVRLDLPLRHSTRCARPRSACAPGSGPA